jgi:hypothetical protein
MRDADAQIKDLFQTAMSVCVPFVAAAAVLAAMVAAVLAAVPMATGA